MLMLSCLGMAACILIYISIMKRVSEKRRKKIKLLQRHLKEIDKKKKNDSEK